eukprot:TRINITY_DN34191_c0_g1_i1.p1 TRINITY_DN34191_c0_g1~~TRINITY_DN34191_c0_g1_i1.p1  ORF type:complete len:414 (+),score=29.39 TRINITY_DN34191_c0_g1_i1:22-1263(+)
MEKSTTAAPRGSVKPTNIVVTDKVLKCFLTELRHTVHKRKLALQLWKEQWQHSRSEVDRINAVDNTTIAEEEGMEVLCLDVGGTEIHTLKATLRGCAEQSDSMLSVWLGGEWSSFWTVEKEAEDDLVFLDRDGELFQKGGVLDWLRDGHDHTLFRKSTNNITPETSLFLWSNNQTDWVSQLLQEAEYYGLENLQQWCLRTLTEIWKLDFGKIFDQYHVSSALKPEFGAAVCDNPLFKEGKVATIASGHAIPAASGSFEFSVEVQSETANISVGYICQCCIKDYQTHGKRPVRSWRSPQFDDQGVPHEQKHCLFEYKNCDWPCQCTFDVKAERGDTIGVHLGVSELKDGSEARLEQAVWVTKNECTLQGPKVVEGAGHQPKYSFRAEPPIPPSLGHMLVPYMFKRSGVAQVSRL